MTRKHARSKFYKELRAIASNYQWVVINGAIRGRFKNPRDQKNTPFWPLFCPLTASYHGNNRYERVKLSEYKVAGELLKLDPLDSALIAHSADYSNHPTGNKQVRETLLKCVGITA
jgi:hypothetical protein